MKRTLKTIFLLLASVISFSQLSFAQMPNLDSLWSIWQDDSLSDTIRSKALRQIALEGYLKSQPDSAIYYAQLQLTFAQKKGLKKECASALNTLGRVYSQLADYSKALKNYRMSQAIWEQLDYKKGIAICLNNIGAVYHVQNIYLQALNYYKKSLVIYEELESEKGVAMMYNNIGSIYTNLKNYSIALEYYQKSLVARKKLGDKDGIRSVLNNMASIYRNQGKYIQSLEYANKSRAIAEELGDKFGIASAMHLIGMTYMEQGNFPMALEYVQKSIVLEQELGNKSGIAFAENTLGEIYLKQGNFQFAMNHCKKALELTENIGILEEQKAACNCIYLSYKGKGKGNEALLYLEKMNAIDDSLHAEESNKKLQQMEFDKQVMQDSIANADKVRLVKEAHEEEVRQEKQTRNGSIIAGVFALLLAGGFYGRWRYTRKAKAAVEKEKVRSENLLLNILPEEIAEELKENGRAKARNFDKISIIFTDFKGFTELSTKLSAEDLVNEINHCFEAFDGIMEKYDIEKIKTIGDAYMAAGGLPVPTEDSVKNTVLAALEMQAFIEARSQEQSAKNLPHFTMRVGIHTGPVVAGIVGVKKFQYDIWGDTVNTASRMESSGEVGKVNISEATYSLLQNHPEFSFEHRGKILAKGKGELEMYFVDRRTS